MPNTLHTYFNNFSITLNGVFTKFYSNFITPSQACAVLDQNKDSPWFPKHARELPQILSYIQIKLSPRKTSDKWTCIKKYC